VTSSLNGIAELIGPGLFTLTFAAFIDPGRGVHLRGASFLLAALILLGAALLAVRVTRVRSPARPDLPH
jgi:MFS transporter, DHA1 family, tetracycline resistance protein